jgi:uncharacterized protein (TIGR00661 family)
MKVLYGVQGTGNGHITRAIALTEALTELKSEVENLEFDMVLSGRSPEPLPIEANSFTWRQGLTFITSAGNVQMGKTIMSNNIPRLLMDIRNLDVEGYDVILSDFEPIVSWAAKLRGKKSIGIGHQYAFNFNVPMRGEDWLNTTVMRNFAPADTAIGLHWHHFDHPILPPIVDIEPDIDREIERDKVIVYLPFEDAEQVIAMLKKCPDYQFYVYHPKLVDADDGNIHRRRTSRVTFKDDLYSANAVICNTGFELISECLALGIKIFTKPLAGQVEQLSNGAALSELDYATVTDNLFLPSIEKWLKSCRSVRVTYPNVHECLARWICNGTKESVEELAERMWRDVEVVRSSSRG